jgi:hypothetical protein
MFGNLVHIWRNDRDSEPLPCGPTGELEMHKMMLSVVFLALIAVSPGFARGGGGHSHGHGSNGLSAPANPSVPPSLTPDARLTGTAPLPTNHPHTTVSDGTNVKPDPEDAKVDRVVKSICRGC